MRVINNILDFQVRKYSSNSALISDLSLLALLILNLITGLCYRCEAFPSSTVYINSAKLRQIELKATALKRICAACCGTSNLDLVECASVDCEIYYSRKQLEKSSSGLVELE